MSWQVCPLCGGTGQTQAGQVVVTCAVCVGKRIIGSDGQPPKEQQSQSVPELKPEEIVKPLSPLDDFSDEEILYYATPYYDELQRKKEMHKEKLKQEDSLHGN
jgi:hypothetical protein